MRTLIQVLLLASLFGCTSEVVNKVESQESNRKEPILFVNDYNKEVSCLIWLNDEPIAWLPKRPNFQRHTSYPLRNGSNEIKIATLDPAETITLADFEVGFSKGGESHLLVPSSTEKSNKFEFNFQLAGSNSIFEQASRLSKENLSLCETVTLSLLHAISHKNTESIRRLIALESDLSPFLDPRFKITWHASEQGQLRFITGTSVVLVIPAEKSDLHQNRFLNESLLAGQIEESELTIKQFIFCFNRGEMYLYGKLGWMKVTPEEESPDNG